MLDRQLHKFYISYKLNGEVHLEWVEGINLRHAKEKIEMKPSRKLMSELIQTAATGNDNPTVDFPRENHLESGTVGLDPPRYRAFEFESDFIGAREVLLEELLPVLKRKIDTAFDYVSYEELHLVVFPEMTKAIV